MTTTEKQRIFKRTEEIRQCTLAVDGAQALTSDYCNVFCWDLKNGKSQKCFSLTEGGQIIHFVGITADGKKAIIGSRNSSREQKQRSYYHPTHSRNTEAKNMLQKYGRSCHQDIDFSAWDNIGSSKREKITFDDPAFLYIVDLERRETEKKIIISGSESLQITPDGKTAISGNLLQYSVIYYDGDDYGRANQSGANNNPSLFLWDLATGKNLLTLPAGIASILAIAISDDSQTAVTLHQHQEFSVWDLKNKAPVLKESSYSEAKNICLSGDGRWAIVQFSRDIQLWDVREKSKRKIFKRYLHRIRKLAITKNGQRIVAALDNGLLIHDRNDALEARLMLRENCMAITCLAITPDGEKAVTGSNDGSLILWDLGR